MISEQGVAAAQKLIGDTVVFVVGHYCSGSSIPASKLYEAAVVLQISPASTNPLLTEQGRDNVFRVIGRDDAQGIVAATTLLINWDLWSPRTRTRRGDTALVVNVWFYHAGPGMVSE